MVRASAKAEQAAFTIFGPVNAGMAVKTEIHFSKNTLWAGLQTVPTGFAAAGIQADIRGEISFSIPANLICALYPARSLRLIGCVCRAKDGQKLPFFIGDVPAIGNQQKGRGKHSR